MFKDVARYSIGSLSWALIFLLMVAVARFLGPQEFGRFAWVLAYAYLFDPLLDAGFYRLTIQKTERRPSATRRYLMHSLAWKAGLSAVVLGAFLFDLLPTGNDPRVTTAVGLMLTAGCLRSMKDAMRSALVGRGLYVRDVLSLGSERVALFVGGVIALWLDGGMTAVCGIFVAVRAASIVHTWWLSREPLLAPQLAFRPDFLRSALASGFLVAVAGVGLSLWGHVSVVMLGAFRFAAEVGWFSAANWMRATLLVVPGVMGAVLVPRFAKRHHDDPAGFELFFGGGVKYACAAGMAITANGLLLAPALVKAVFGEGYTPVSDCFSILLLGLPAVFGLAFFQGSLLRMNRSRRILSVGLAGLVLHVTLGWIMIPRHGPQGAAVTTVAAETALFLAYYLVMRRRMPGVGPAVFLKAPASLTAAAVGAWIVRDHGLQAQLASANAIFALFLLFSGFVVAPERRVLLSVLRRVFNVAAPSPASQLK